MLLQDIAKDFGIDSYEYRGWLRVFACYTNLRDCDDLAHSEAVSIMENDRVCSNPRWIEAVAACYREALAQPELVW